MSKVLAIDYGTKRVGIAETDELQIIATRLTSVHSKDLIKFLTDYVKNNDVEAIVIGKPIKLSGEDTDISEIVRNFVIHLKRVFQTLEIVEIDERYTSKIASNTISSSGLSKNKRRNKKLIDEVSAVILLQDYLKRKENGFL